jgi:hypothetical protein
MHPPRRHCTTDLSGPEASMETFLVGYYASMYGVMTVLTLSRTPLK